ncbi:unnamed protein product [Prunus armeniaca]
MLDLRYALGLGRAFDLQDSKGSVRPRAPVWYRPKALRCLSKYGFGKIELQINRQYASFDVGLWASIVGLPRVPRGEVALIGRSVGTVLKLGAEGFHSFSLVHVSDAHWLFILEMLSNRSVTQLVEGLNFGTSVLVHSEVDVEEVRRGDPEDEITLHFVRSESSVEAISDDSIRYSKQFPTGLTVNQEISGVANGKKSDFRQGNRKHSSWSSSRARHKMSDSESFSEREPNAFGEESSDGLFDSDSEAVGLDSGDGSDTDVEILSEGPSSAPSHGIRKGLMTAPVPLVIVYSDGRHIGQALPGEMSASRQSEASTSGRGESAAEPSSRLRVSVVYPSNPRVPIGVPNEHLFGVDYLEPNRITEREIAKYRAEYFILDSVGMRIPTPTESLSKPKNGEVVFFTDVLLKGVRLPLQLAV